MINSVHFSAIKPALVSEYTDFINNKVLVNEQTRQAYVLIRKLNTIEPSFPALDAEPSRRKPHALLTYALAGLKEYKTLTLFTDKLKHVLYANGLIDINAIADQTPWFVKPFVRRKLDKAFVKNNPYLALPKDSDFNAQRPKTDKDITIEDHYDSFRSAVAKVYNKLKGIYLGSKEKDMPESD